MNKRIQELAEQARKYFPKTNTSGEFWVFDEQKFAELIVKECTDTLMLEHEKVKGQHNFYHVTANMLKDHFEVKE